jgi:hypothetical protein
LSGHKLRYLAIIWKSNFTLKDEVLQKGTCDESHFANYQQHCARGWHDLRLDRSITCCHTSRRLTYWRSFKRPYTGDEVGFPANLIH